MESNQYKPPVRKSLTDEELAARVNYATSTKMGIEAMMDLVVAQEALRAQEDFEIQNWLKQMDAEGTPEAITAAENYRKSSSGFIPPPVVQPAVEDVVEEKPTSFSWFTKPELVEEIPEIVVEEVVVEEVILVVEDEEPETEPETEPEFEEKPVEIEIDDEIEVVEPVAVAVQVGSETADEFEHLLSSAAAEEELTALEESESQTSADLDREATTNTLIPSDEHRNRKPISQLIVWLGVSATIVPVVLTWILISLGLSSTSVLFDLAIGYLIAGAFIATATLAGKRSGLSTSIVSRAVFGVWGNAIPGAFVFVARVAITALLLAFTALLVNGVDSRIPDLRASVTSVGSFNVTVGLTASAIMLILVAAVSMIRGRASRLAQIILSLLAFAAMVVSFVGISNKTMEFDAPGLGPIGSKESMLGASIVVLVVTLLWVAVAPNLAKAVPMRERGLKVFGWSAIANFVVPALVGVTALTWLGPRSKELAALAPLTIGTFVQIVLELPEYAKVSFFAAILITLGYALLLNLKTAALDLSALVPIRSRVAGLLLSVLAVIAALILFAMQPENVTLDYLVNVFLLLAAISAGWIGMIVTDVALRRIAYHELSLSRSYGFYKRFSVVSILSWMLSVAAGLALMPIHLNGFNFTGFGDELLGLERNITAAPIGFVLTLLVGVLLTFAARIPEIRKQEREVLAVEARRDQLNNIFLGQE